MDHPLRPFWSAAHCGLAALALTACTMATPTLGNPESPYPLAKLPQVGDILHLPTGTLVNEADMLAAVSDVHIVYVGETHDNPASHRVQLTVLKAMAERWPGQVSLGMEMFTRQQQPTLDRWVSGELSEKAFLKEADWYSVWNMDFAFYRDLLIFARDHRIPVIGLNADKDLVNAIGDSAPEAMPDELRARLPELDLTDPYHSAMVKAMFSGHPASDNVLESFRRKQTLWDETMAESIADHLRSDIAGARRMVVLAGGNHVRYGFGIPRRVFRRLPTSYLMVGSHEVTIPESKQGQLMNVTMPGFPMPPYDYEVFVAYEDLPGERVKLGVRMEEQDGKVAVLAVVPGSSADQGGVQAGDIILAIDGEPIAENFDLIYAIGQRQKGDRATLTVERAGETLNLEVELQPLPQPVGHKP